MDFVAGAIFGDVGLSFLVARAAFREILVDSRSAKCCNFYMKCVSEMGQVRSQKRRVRDEDFILGSCSDFPRIMVEAFLFSQNLHGYFGQILSSNFVTGAIFGDVGG